MEISNKTVREIALEIPASTKVFEELKIDYCCGGNVKLVDACEIAQVATTLVEEKIEAAVKRSTASPDYVADAGHTMGITIELIVEKHHRYTKKEIDRLRPLMNKVARKHGGRHPFLLDLKTAFDELCEELLPHMQKEELILFPYIINLETSAKSGLPLSQPPFGSVRNPIRMMTSEHEAAGEILKEMRALTSEYVTPADACPSFNALYFGLEELEKDLHRHIHLENNILFPTAIEQESRMLAATV